MGSRADVEAPALSFSLFAVASLIAAAFIFARRPGLTLTDADQAVRLFLTDYWDASVERVSLSSDGKSALLSLSDGKMGIVAVFSDRAVTRRLAPRAVRAAVSGDRLELRIGDPSLSRLRLALSASDLDEWAARLAATRSEPELEERTA